MKEMLEYFEAELAKTLADAGERPAGLFEAMRYAVGTGGKRIRPLVTMLAAQAVGGDWRDAVGPACAIELLHNYTLVHDDLPAMDNDTVRRGQPSVWAKFGEANAILVGDALQALAYRVAAKAPRKVAEIVETLGEKGVGVVAGQVEDIARTPDVDFIYLHKTADLFIAAAKMGGLAGGGDEFAVAALEDFAFNLGLAFQFEDDLLDGDSPYGEAETKALVAKHTALANAALDKLPGDTAPLQKLAERLINRTV